MDSFFKSIILLVLLTSSCRIFDIENQNYKHYSNKLNTQTKEDGWLIMIYMSATGTLEDESIADLENIEIGHSELFDKKDVDIVVLYDRGPGYSVANGDLTGTYLYSYNNDGFQVIDSVVGWRDSYDQEESMGEIETLRVFLSWARDKYPRSNNALILWNHGGGIAGASPNETRAICWDTEDVNSEISEVLYIDEIQKLLSTIYNDNNRLDILGFDACYMGMIEIIYEFRDTVEYVVASSAAETGGWIYQNFISKIKADTVAEVLAVDIVNEYYKFSLENNLQNTLAAYYVPAVKLFVEKLDIVFDKLLYMDKDVISSVRDEVSTYYSSNSVLETLMYPYINLFDLIDKLSGQSELSTISNELIIEFSKLIKESFDLYSGFKDKEAVSLFFPLNSDDYKSCWWYTGSDTGTYGNIDFCNDTLWKVLLDNWYETGN